MAELGYIYHRGAATLRGARSGVLGMVINDLSNPFFVEMAIGIEDACQGGAFIPFLANTVENPARQAQVIRSMREHGAAGMLLSPAIGTSLGELKPLIADMPGRAGDAPGAWPQGVAGRAGEPRRRAQGDAASDRARPPAHRLRRRLLDDERARGAASPAIATRSTPPASPSTPRASSRRCRPTPAARQVAASLLNLPDPPTAALCFNDVVAIGAHRVRSPRRRRGRPRLRGLRLRRHRRGQVHVSGADQRRRQRAQPRRPRRATADAPDRQRRLRAESVLTPTTLMVARLLRRAAEGAL